MNGAPANPINGNPRRQRFPDQLDRLRHERERRDLIERPHPIDVRSRSHRVVNDRPFALGKFELKPQRLEDQQDVGEQNRGVDAQHFGGGDGHFRGQVGPFAQLEERNFRANGPILGHVPAGLPHQPDRRDVRRLAPAGLEKQ